MATTKELRVEDKLRALYALQLIDSKIDEIENVRGELPLEVEDLEEEFHIDLQKIKIKNVDILKTNLADTLTLEAFIDKAETRFKKDETYIKMGLDAAFVFNIIKDKDTTFVKNKHFCRGDIKIFLARP